MKKLIIAPDSFKGTMTSQEVCALLAGAARRVFPEAETVCIPVADGGEGSAAAFLAAAGGRWVPMDCTGPNGRPVSAGYALLPDGTAVVELAAAAGFALADPRDPEQTTTLGVGELLRAAADAAGAGAVVAIDALAARSRDRLCATVQLGDTGLIPGSGVGNRRNALDRETLGVPVVAVGVPTVIAAAPGGGEELFLTPRDIDEKVRELGRVIGYGVTLALQPGLSVEDITGLLG